MFKDLSKVSKEEHLDGWEETEDHVRPVEFVVHHGPNQKVGKHHGHDHTGDKVSENLKTKQFVHLVAEGTQVSVDAA